MRSRNPVFALEMIQTPTFTNINLLIESQSSIRPGDDSDTVSRMIATVPMRSQSSIRPGDDSDIPSNTELAQAASRNPVFALEMIQTTMTPIHFRVTKSQSSIRPGDDSDSRNLVCGWLDTYKSRNPVFALEMIQTIMLFLSK